MRRNLSFLSGIVAVGTQADNRDAFNGGKRRGSNLSSYVGRLRVPSPGKAVSVTAALCSVFSVQCSARKDEKEPALPTGSRARHRRRSHAKQAQATGRVQDRSSESLNRFSKEDVAGYRATSKCRITPVGNP